MSGLVGGAAASLLSGGTVALADEQGESAIVTKAVHLADKDGKVRAIIRIGDESDPEVSLMDEKGKVRKREKLVAPREPVRMVEIGEQSRLHLDDPKSPIIRLPEAGPDHDCLVLHRRVGFAIDQPEGSDSK